MLSLFEAEGLIDVDQAALLSLTEWCKASEKTTNPSALLSYIAKVPFDDNRRVHSIELSITLPLNYPSRAQPSILIRCNSLPRRLIDQLEDQLRHQAKEDYFGDCCLYQLIDATPSLLQPLFESYNQSESIQSKSGNLTADSFMRQFIYFHHIYNKSKRRDILAYGTTCYVFFFY